MVDLKIYYSPEQNVKEPGDSNSYKQYCNPNPHPASHSLTNPTNRDTYDNDWVYLSMFSNSGCNITATVKFRDEKD